MTPAEIGRNFPGDFETMPKDQNGPRAHSPEIEAGIQISQTKIDLFLRCARWRTPGVRRSLPALEGFLS